MNRGMERTVQPSVLDRLMRDTPHESDDPTLTWAESVAALKEAVRRDLEWLLNTRRTPQPPPESCDEVRHSLYVYGLPDFTARGGSAPDIAARIAREVEGAIAVFEPRLAAARVTPAEREASGDRRLHFVIEALLRLEPTPERVVFDTVLHAGRHQFEVGAGTGGTTGVTGRG